MLNGFLQGHTILRTVNRKYILFTYNQLQIMPECESFFVFSKGRIFN